MLKSVLGFETIDLFEDPRPRMDLYFNEEVENNEINSKKRILMMNLCEALEKEYSNLEFQRKLDTLKGTCHIFSEPYSINLEIVTLNDKKGLALIGAKWPKETKNALIKYKEVLEKEL